MVKQKIKSPFLFGISGAIFGFLVISICFWSLTIGMSFSSMLFLFIQLSIAPIIIGIFSGLLSKKFLQPNGSITFWVSFVASFISMPLAIFFLELRNLTSPTIGNLQISRLILLTGSLLVIGLFLDALLFIAIKIWTRVKKAI